MPRRLLAPRRPPWGPRAAVRGPAEAIGRRGLLGVMVAAPLMIAAGGEPPVLRPRKARFEEVGDAVLMTVGLPELLLSGDAGAMDWLESAFATALTYEIAVHRVGEAEPLERRTVLVRIQWNAWKERYVVALEEPGRGVTTRSFTDRDEAIAAAVTLERLRIARAGALDRGPDAKYFATVVGQRNPVERGLHAAGGGQTAGREGSTFSRWLGIFIRSQQRAETTAAIRTSPAFYLVPR